MYERNTPTGYSELAKINPSSVSVSPSLFTQINIGMTRAMPGMIMAIITNIKIWRLNLILVAASAKPPKRLIKVPSRTIDIVYHKLFSIHLINTSLSYCIKLRQRVKLDQYDDFKGRGDDEAEERVNVPIPLKGYVKSIHLPASWKHDEKAMQYYEPKLKQYGIPFYYDTMGSPEDRNADVPRLEEASGYIPSEKQKNDPRFKTALTVDINPYTMKKGAKQFNWNISRAGIPPTAKANGNI